MEKKRITRRRIFEIIQIGKDTDIPSRVFDFVIVAMVVICVVVSVCITFQELSRWVPVLHTVEVVIVAFFTFELGLRLLTADFIYKRGRIASAVRYCFSFNGIVEILTVVPFYMPLMFPQGLIAFRLIRVVRILRIFQANTYSDALSTILIVLRRRRSQILSSLLIIFLFMIMASLLMYGFEHQAQPEVFKNAFSGIWWSTSTLLTVGYGDIYPITIGGQIVSIAITFLGVGLVAIPTGILSAGFTEHISEQKETGRTRKAGVTCPYCGEGL